MACPRPHGSGAELRLDPSPHWELCEAGVMSFLSLSLETSPGPGLGIAQCLWVNDGLPRDALTAAPNRFQSGGAWEALSRV